MAALPATAQRFINSRSRGEKLFLSLLVAYLIAIFAIPESSWVALLQIALLFTGLFLLFRATRKGIRHAIWRLRNRLLVTYLFIALVPILLIVTLAGIGAYTLGSQIAVYLASSELDRRVAMLRSTTQTILHNEPQGRADVMRRLIDIYQDRFPGLTFHLREARKLTTVPAASELQSPPSGVADDSGVVLRDGRYLAFAHVLRESLEITAVAPLSPDYLSGLVPGLGRVFFYSPKTEDTDIKRKVGAEEITIRSGARQTGTAKLPPKANRFDIDLVWGALIPVADWDSSSGKRELSLLSVHTRPSAILNIISSQKVEWVNNVLPILLISVGVLFLIVECVSLIIGMSLTRTITSAVHGLYQGTQKVMQGDFAHRIGVTGGDQLADLGRSFNTMAANLERLLAVAKESERMQAELEIAREVQSQLYPRTIPESKLLRLTAGLHPARSVSGDYYDYQCLAEQKIAVAMGDVAGKGISAALLMATIQAAMRMELRGSMEMSAPSGRTRMRTNVSAAQVVSELNQQLHAHTSPEKFSTLFFGIFDEPTSTLTYTNAGHLPPLLVRNGTTSLLDVNGMVVGAFPFSKYEESRLRLEPGDLLVFYTDGITEPENEYGEMFGEERLFDLVLKHADQPEENIMENVMASLRQWTGDVEQSDDMTLMLARRL